MDDVHRLGNESRVRSKIEQCVPAQSNKVGVRVRIAGRFVAGRNLGGWNPTVLVRVMRVIVSRGVVAVAMEDLMRMLHLHGRVGTSHVNERNR